MTELKQKGNQIIVIGDTNINEHDKENKYTMEWKKQMKENEMHNIHTLYWPTIQHKMHTWELNGKRTWIEVKNISLTTKARMKNG